jgi:hypothetical protein
MLFHAVNTFLSCPLSDNLPLILNTLQSLYCPPYHLRWHQCHLCNHQFECIVTKHIAIFTFSAVISVLLNNVFINSLLLSQYETYTTNLQSSDLLQQSAVSNDIYLFYTFILVRISPFSVNQVTCLYQRIFC